MPHITPLEVAALATPPGKSWAALTTLLVAQTGASSQSASFAIMWAEKKGAVARVGKSKILVAVPGYKEPEPAAEKEPASLDELQAHFSAGMEKSFRHTLAARHLFPGKFVRLRRAARSGPHSEVVFLYVLGPEGEPTVFRKSVAELDAVPVSREEVLAHLRQYLVKAESPDADETAATPAG